MKYPIPKDRAEFDRLEEIAYQKYKPLVDGLTAPELLGLSRAVQEGLEIADKRLAQHNVRHERGQYGTNGRHG